MRIPRQDATSIPREVHNEETIPIVEASRPELTSGSDDSDGQAGDEVCIMDPSSLPIPSTGTTRYLTRYLEIDAWELVESVWGEFSSSDLIPGLSTKKGLWTWLEAKPLAQLESLRRSLRFSRQPEVAHRVERCNGDVMVVETSTIMRQHLACPFYLRDKEKYLTCLTRADLRGIRDLKDHLWTNHLQPSYCPTCHNTFMVAEDWENHIQRRRCVSSAKPRPAGITALQMQLLSQPADPWTSRDAQWLSIWNTVFPGAQTPPTLMPDEVETRVWALRDFWAAEGHRIVSNYLTDRQQQRPHLRTCELNQIKLGSLVLELVIDQLVAPTWQEKGA